MLFSKKSTHRTRAGKCGLHKPCLAPRTKRHRTLLCPPVRDRRWQESSGMAASHNLPESAGASTPDEQLRYAEGQRSLMATILRLIDRGRTQ